MNKVLTRFNNSSGVAGMQFGDPRWLRVQERGPSLQRSPTGPGGIYGKAPRILWLFVNHELHIVYLSCSRP